MSAVALALGLGLVGAAPATAHPAAPPAPAATATVEAAPAAPNGAGMALAQPVVGIASTTSGRGYWLVARDGGIFSFGDAAFHGSTGAMRLNQPIVGMAATPTGGGYWFVAADGGIFSFGDAAFHGSTGAMRLNQPIVGMAATSTGRGYWLVARDGGIFAFGDAAFMGSTGSIRLNQPIVGMSRTRTGRGYWLVAGDGGVFTFGDAPSRGTAAGRAHARVVGMASSPTGGGYWVASEDGAVFPFGDAPSYTGATAGAPVVGIAAPPTGAGFLLATTRGDVVSTTAAPANASSYGFLRMTRDGGPARYDPCTPAHYVVNPAGAPAGAVEEVHEAFRRLGAATGIRFTFDGTTDEGHLPFGTRETYQPQRYGTRWAPILVSWAGPDTEPLLAGGVLGYGGSTSYWTSESDEAFVSGEVVFDVDTAVLRPGFGGGLSRGNLVLHELGHLAGLDHVDDRGQLMYPSVHGRSPDGFAAGDLAGLGAVGAENGCLDVATPR